MSEHTSNGPGSEPEPTAGGQDHLGSNAAGADTPAHGVPIHREPGVSADTGPEAGAPQGQAASAAEERDGGSSPAGTPASGTSTGSSPLDQQAQPGGVRDHGGPPQPGQSSAYGAVAAAASHQNQPSPERGGAGGFGSTGGLGSTGGFGSTGGGLGNTGGLGAPPFGAQVSGGTAGPQQPGGPDQPSAPGGGQPPGAGGPAGVPGGYPGYGQHYSHSYRDQPAGRRPKGRGSVVAGVVALSLLVGGVAGGVGGLVGYQLADGGTSVNSLDQEPPPARNASDAPEGSVQEVADKVLPSVVQLQVQSQQGASEGSGIILSDDGLIMTNNHVIAPAAGGGEIVIAFEDGTTAPAQIEGRDPTSDLAVVRAEGVSGLTPAELGRSDDLAVGEQAVAIGSPFGLVGTVTSGIISALDRPVAAGGESPSDVATVLDAVQTDAAINPGNSGGPLVDMQGRVIGVNSVIYSPRGEGQQQAGSVGLGFAIPIDQARRIAEEIIDTGQATQAVLGVTVTDPRQGSGAEIAEVSPDGAAAESGLSAGEIITRVDDRLIQGRDALVAAVRSQDPGQQVTLTVLDSGGGERSVDVTLGSQTVGE
ncbi:MULTISPECIES: S1C family serine protease [Actinoalloteichus]|uniref:Trypsin-like serine protease with C-terminal PDZ domain n=1 Tax=Actinoalloteichus fjordicus TaxID=1612552 RepID=A0AAC9L9B9_9PSEU|nr:MULTISPECIES: trypsin-like peptidase domain-containing protein [Actinoalloteichus]APU12729.1 trypsin-like serine protease with C-terminal PDZ domain [Actinoalloteichus fjordicus]APU18699.1 trypsin-like serine protease with C-terminal PDZ domain [Actinoalloteichus sp. GBA129-24]